MRRGTMTAAALAAAILGDIVAAPPGAPAATIVAGTTCYPSGGSVSITGSGFGPGALVTAHGAGIEGRATADLAGGVQIAAIAQRLSPRTPIARAVTLTATDGVNTAQTVVRVTNFTFSVQPSVRRPSARVTWRVSGFPAGARVYAHYVHAGHEYARVLFGRMPTPCGILRERVAMLPVSHPPSGAWRIQLDTRRTYRASTIPRLALTGTIRRR